MILKIKENEPENNIHGNKNRTEAGLRPLFKDGIVWLSDRLHSRLCYLVIKNDLLIIFLSVTSWGITNEAGDNFQRGTGSI